MNSKHFDAHDGGFDERGQRIFSVRGEDGDSESSCEKWLQLEKPLANEQ